MTINPKVWNFPTFPISKQLFHVPGASVDGGFTSGGARITSPEPGGFSTLEVQPSLQINEWDYPLSSWLMSKGNGQILRIRLTATPQVVSNRSAYLASVPWAAETVFVETPWNNGQEWDASDLPGVYATDALEGTAIVQIDMAEIGPILQPGHVIGHAGETYLVDEISYVETVATITVNPPLRRNVNSGDVVRFRPYFTGMIANPGDFRTTYDADKVGLIQLGMIILQEVVVP